MSTNESDAFERAAEKEYRRQQYGRRNPKSAWVPMVMGVGSLAAARRSFHTRLNWLLFLAMALGLHWYLVQSASTWFITHSVLTAVLLLSVVSAWGHQRVADALEKERTK